MIKSSMTAATASLLSFLVFIQPVPLRAGEAAQPVSAAARTALSVTVYNQDLALIDERRAVTLQPGGNRLALEDISTGLRPETLQLRGAGLNLVEQSFVFDLLTQRRLAEASVGQDVQIVKRHPQTGEETYVTARLLSVAESPLVQIGDRIQSVRLDRLVFTELPPGLRAKPTLLALLNSDATGEKDLDISYLTSGLSWRADYTARLNAEENQLDLTAMVTLTNGTGTAFDDAALRLVAGDVNQAPPALQRAQMKMMTEAAAMPIQAVMTPRTVSDRKVYSLDHKTTLMPKETKQVALLTANAVTLRKDYRFENLVSATPGADDIGPVNADITLDIDNKAESGLGKPLPAGVVRVYQAAADTSNIPGNIPGGELFVGEESISHTPEGETLHLRLGAAFDITGTAKRTAYEQLSQRSFETAQAITIKNAKDAAVQVRLVGHLPRGWRMVSESLRHALETANRIVWTLNVPAKGEAKLDYRVRINR